MEKLILILGITVILLMIFICLLLLKIINKLYSREIKEKKEKKLKRKFRVQEFKIKEKESDLSLKKWYDMNFIEKYIFHTNFIPGFKLEKTIIEEEKV